MWQMTHQTIDFEIRIQERGVIQVSGFAGHQGQFPRSYRLRHLRVHVVGT